MVAGQIAKMLTGQLSVTKVNLLTSQVAENNGQLDNYKVKSPNC